MRVVHLWREWNWISSGKPILLDEQVECWFFPFSEKCRKRINRWGEPDIKYYLLDKPWNNFKSESIINSHPWIIISGALSFSNPKNNHNGCHSLKNNFLCIKKSDRIEWKELKSDLSLKFIVEIKNIRSRVWHTNS